MRTLSDALLYVQRRGWRPPPAMRRAARHVVGRSAVRTPPVDGWTTRLTGDGPLGPAPAPRAPAGTWPGAGGEVREEHAGRLRCLIVTGILDVGGSDEVVAFLARRLNEHGIDPTVVHTGTTVTDGRKPGGRLATMLREEGIPVVEVTEASAEALVEEHRPDVISAHGAPEWWLDLASGKDIPWVETLHGMHSFFGVDWPEETVRSARVSRIVAVSELVRRQYLAGNAGIDPARVVTVPNSVDDRRMPYLDRESAREWLGLDGDFLFVSLARFSLQKNSYGLVDAFAEVAETHPDARLLIAGRPDEGPYASQVRALRDGLACRDRIHLRDHVAWPAALLAAADGFVLDSYFEGWSLASMEALYAGVPVILSDVGGAREQVGGDGRRGYVVGNPIGDPLDVDWTTIRSSLYSRQPNRDELVAAMRTIIDEREHRAGQRETLRAESATRFHPDHALAGHAGVIRAAVEERVPS